MPVAADSKQLVILKAITAHLEGLVLAVPAPVPEFGPLPEPPDPPVSWPLAGRVFRGKTVFGAEETGPFLSLLEGRRPDQGPLETREDGLLRNEDWPLLVQGFMDDDPDSPLDNLYRLKGIVEERLAMLVAVNPGTGLPSHPEIYLAGGLLLDLKIGPGSVLPATPQTGGTEAFYLPCVARFAADVAAPFNTN